VTRDDEPPTPAARRAAFQAIFDAEFSYVCRALRRLGVRPADVEDVAQDVFIKVHDRFDGYDQSRPIRPWLFAFVLRIAANHLRRARHRHEVDGPVPDAASRRTPEDDLIDEEARRLVLAALQGVPLVRRGALIMHDMDGFTGPEIAGILQVPINTVYSRVRVARVEFKAALRRETLRRGKV